MAVEEKDRDDVMDRLLQLGGDKKFLSYDDLNRELPENVVSPDDIEDVLQKLDASNIHVADSDERLIEQAAAIATDDEEAGDEDSELELSAVALHETQKAAAPASQSCPVAHRDCRRNRPAEYDRALASAPDQLDSQRAERSPFSRARGGYLQRQADQETS